MPWLLARHSTNEGVLNTNSSVNQRAQCWWATTCGCRDEDSNSGPPGSEKSTLPPGHYPSPGYVYIRYVCTWYTDGREVSNVAVKRKEHHKLHRHLHAFTDNNQRTSLISLPYSIHFVLEISVSISNVAFFRNFKSNVPYSMGRYAWNAVDGLSSMRGYKHYRWNVNKCTKSFKLFFIQRISQQSIPNISFK